jgi:hypothetical protein
MGVTQFDSMVACWDAKYTYWAIRPSQLDSTLTTLFPNPNHPSYPSAHGCVTSGIGSAIGYLFPQEAQFMREKAEESGFSRLWRASIFAAISKWV